MVTAVNCMIFIPVGIDLYFHLGFRATALSCLYYRERTHSDCSCTSTCATGNVQLSASTANDLDEHEHAMHSAYLVAVVVLPATIGFAATVGFPLWILLLCRSPLNSLFAYLYQTMLALQACFGLLVSCNWQHSSHARFRSSTASLSCIGLLLPLSVRPSKLLTMLMAAPIGRYFSLC